jgi:cardiolipin synthase
MVRVSGAGVYALQRAFLIDWYFVDRTLISDRSYYPDHLLKRTEHTTTLLQVVTSSPVSPYAEILQGFLRLIFAARQYIYIETPYFLPNESMLLALKTAAASGIDVRILVPLRNDSWFLEWASHSYLREMHEAGATVSLYSSGFLHSKVIVSDDSICSCGSTNVDFRSFENNFEANVFIYDKEVSRRLRDIFLDDERQAVPLGRMPDRLHPSFLAKLWESTVRLLSPLM